MTVLEFIGLCRNIGELRVCIFILGLAIFDGPGTKIPEEYMNAVIDYMDIGSKEVTINL